VTISSDVAKSCPLSNHGVWDGGFGNVLFNFLCLLSDTGRAQAPLLNLGEGAVCTFLLEDCVCRAANTIGKAKLT